MTTNWSQEKHEDSSWVESESERCLRVGPESPVPIPTARIACASTNRADAESLPTAVLPRWKTWFIGLEGTLAAVAGGAIFFSLDVASFGILACAVTVAGLVAAFGLGHYLFWGSVLAGRGVREKRPFRIQARR